ncbi:hypothetical protein SEA_FREGLEY_99 [Microbacterium phage Fregley]|nr:hypothetical protein SEA_FREGLEY_99 [Microbacterium phage Fregley]
MSAPKPTIDIACPVCQSPAGKRCTAPTITSRKEVSWLHAGRIETTPPKSPVQTLAETLLATLEGDETVTMIACECGRDVDIFPEQTIDAVVALLEHAAFEHGTRRDIHVYRTTTLLNGYEIGVLLRLPTLSDHESKWREARTRT